MWILSSLLKFSLGTPGGGLAHVIRMHHPTPGAK